MDRLFYYVPDAPKDYSGKGKALNAILVGLVEHRRLAMTYESASTGRKEHEIEPLTLALYRGGLHIFARYPGKKRVYMPYYGGFDRYSAFCEEIAADGYRGFKISHHGDRGRSARTTEPS